jgi:hypothetical protein
MSKLSYLVLFGLAGCPPPPRYVVAHVLTTTQPVENALVAIDCGAPTGGAVRTDDRGNARLRVAASASAGACTLLAAKPGFKTAQGSGAQICDTATACPPITIQLYPLGPYGGEPPPASPPAEVAQ